MRETQFAPIGITTITKHYIIDKMNIDGV